MASPSSPEFEVKKFHLQIAPLFHHATIRDVVHMFIWVPVEGPFIIQRPPTLQEGCDIHSLHAMPTYMIFFIIISFTGVKVTRCWLL